MQKILLSIIGIQILLAQDQAFTPNPIDPTDIRFPKLEIPKVLDRL